MQGTRGKRHLDLGVGKALGWVAESAILIKFGNQCI